MPSNKHFNGFHRIQYDYRYRDDMRHNYNQKIVQGYVTGAWSAHAKLGVTHQRTCAMFEHRRNYCNCDPQITIKGDG